MAGALSEAAPRAWLDVQIGDRQPGRLVFELKWDAAPRACANFAALCTGERGYSTTSRLRLHYKGNKIHRLIPGFMMQMGDISPANDGTGGESIYGARFADEAGGLKQKHSARGTLAMANSGKDTNGSQVYVTFAATPWLDGRHVVFGRLVEGEATLAAMERIVTGAQDRPRIPVVIVDCGMTGEYKPAPAAGSAAGAAASAGPTWTAGGSDAAEPVARAVEDLRSLGGDGVRRGVRIEKVLDGAGLPARFGGGASSKRRAFAAAASAGADGGDGAEDGAGRAAAPAREGVVAEAELAQFIRQRIGGSSGGAGASSSGSSGPSLGWAHAAVPEADAEGADAAADGGESDADDGAGGEEEEEEGAEEEKGEADDDTSGLNPDTKDRLFALRMRLNAGRKANHNAVVTEHRKLEAAAQARPSAELRAANAVLKGAEGGAKKKASVMAGQKPVAPEEALVAADTALPSARTDGTAFGAGAGGGRKREGGAASGGAGDKDDEADGSSGVGAKRRRPASHEDCDGDEGAEAEPAPAPMAPAYMFEPASVAQAKAAKREEKERHCLENYGWNAHATNADAQVSGSCVLACRCVAALLRGCAPLAPAHSRVYCYCWASAPRFRAQWRRCPSAPCDCALVLSFVAAHACARRLPVPFTLPSLHFASFSSAVSRL